MAQCVKVLAVCLEHNPRNPSLTSTQVLGLIPIGGGGGGGGGYAL